MPGQLMVKNVEALTTSKLANQGSSKVCKALHDVMSLPPLTRYQRSNQSNRKRTKFTPWTNSWPGFRSSKLSLLNRMRPSKAARMMASFRELPTRHHPAILCPSLQPLMHSRLLLRLLDLPVPMWVKLGQKQKRFFVSNCNWPAPKTTSPSLIMSCPKLVQSSQSPILWP